MLEDPTKVASRILSGDRLMIAGDERLLAQLPKGQWIGGTIPYFVTDRGVTTRDLLHVTELPGNPTAVSIQAYDVGHLERITSDAPENGYTLLIIPFGSDAHYRFAREAPEYAETFLKPVFGWISGVHLDDLGRQSPQVVNGANGELKNDVAVAMHCTLPANLQALIGIINLFRPGTGDALTFDEEGFVIQSCLVNGQRRSFAQYLTDVQADTSRPMVADYFGANVNVSFQKVDLDAQRVALYAPVFRHVTYRLAAPLSKPYEEAYSEAIGVRQFPVSCSCILNYLYGNLEGKPVSGARGAVTFGEIAHQLLNQTTVYLDLNVVV
jgi:hypothetical protein